jgi:DNA-binding winged helix-turn-helix (wHTH) protein/tetratricopeptide (TPR) repeat protein
MSGTRVFSFGAFELDAGSGELRLKGDPVKLPPQPLKVLELLVRRSGELLTRNEIRQHVWCDDTFVDFEHGLNFCIRQIREALGDAAARPRFIETLPRRGYRFLMPVKSAEPAQPAKVTRLIVLPFRMLKPDADTEFLAFSLPDALGASLAGLESLVVRSSMGAARFVADGVPLDPKTVAAEADVDVIVTGTLLRAGDQVRVTSQLTEAASGSLLWSDTAQAPIGDLFRVQDELTRRIIDSLSLPLTIREQQLLRRDVPKSAKAYEYYLRGNQLSYDAKQWTVARDLYLRSIEEDPRYAPAWARLGRIHHVMGKYLPAGTAEGLDLAENAFRKALELNPDLPLAHKLYAQVEVDRGRARDAMARLVERARTADPELFAGLVTTCRYCGLLEASVAAHERAASLEPKLRTSVPHTWYLQGDYARVAMIKPGEFPYIVPLSMAELGRREEALGVLREIEQKIPTRVREMISAARLLLEGNAADSIAAINRFVSDFRDPEAYFYAARHLAHLDERDAAIGLLERAIDGGFFCFPAFAKDPWLDPLRKKAAFTKLLARAETQHLESAALFARVGGARTLGLAGG